MEKYRAWAVLSWVAVRTSTGIPVKVVVDQIERVAGLGEVGLSEMCSGLAEPVIF
jgi:hypothetical protein